MRTRECDVPDPSLPKPARVILPDSLLALWFTSFMTLAALLLGIGLAVQASLRSLIGAAPWMAGAWLAFMIVMTLGTSRSLLAGPGWLAEKRGLRWQIVRRGDSLSVSLRSQPRAPDYLRLEHNGARMDFSPTPFTNPDVGEAVISFINGAEHVAAEDRAMVEHFVERSANGPSRSFSTPVRLWVIGGVFTVGLAVEILLYFV